MLNSQPLNSEISKKLESYEPKKDSLPVKQYMGHMFDGLLDSKISFKTRLSWLGRRISDAWYDFHYTVKNWAKWRKTISGLRPWEGFAGVLTLVQKHLKDYLETEEKYGHSEKSCREVKIKSIKECLEILERFQKRENRTKSVSPTAVFRSPSPVGAKHIQSCYVQLGRILF
ncbi:MAG: hypothetical protein LBI14_08465 [Treponema sp.]|jgi:hypothetical protein|nr:hypothetical protein [Treponema sp.]